MTSIGSDRHPIAPRTSFRRGLSYIAGLIGIGLTYFALAKSGLASLYQLQAAARLPCGGISEMALNAALAMIEAAAPRDEMEAALAIQMACTHAAAMSVLARLGGGHGTERRVAALGSAAGTVVESLFGTGRDFSTASSRRPAVRSGRARPHQ
jgi:hypothetical protein